MSAPPLTTPRDAARTPNAVTQRLAPARAGFARWWRSQAPRDRRILQWGAVVLALALLWLVALAPAARVLRQAQTESDTLDAQLQEMQTLAQEAKGLRAVSPIGPDQARQAMQAAVARMGERVKLNLQGPRAVVTLKDVDSAELAAFLAEARAGARARVQDATLNQSTPGRYDGHLNFSLGGGTP